MNLNHAIRGAVSFLILTLGAGGGTSLLAGNLVEETYPVLQTRTGTYTNVTVTTKADNYVFILHSTGMASIKPSDLPLAIQRQLGYAAAPKPQSVQTNTIKSVAAREFFQVNSSLKPFEAKFRSGWQLRRPIVKINSEIVLTVLLIAAVVYFFFAYCCALICQKAKSPRSFLVWLPGLQMIPLLRAAGMSEWWFLVCLAPPVAPLLRMQGVQGWWIILCVAPVVMIVMHVLWSIKIVKVRGKHVIWAVLLMLPLTSLIAFLYLAFSNSGPSETPSAKFQTRALQGA
jgi:hypothetical protein